MGALLKQRGEYVDFPKRLSISVVLALLLLSFTAAAAITQVSPEGVTGKGPVTNGNKVIYVDSSSRIHIYDVAKMKDVRISKLGKANFRVQAAFPAVSDNKLVWLEMGGKKPQLIVYDLASGRWSSIRTDGSAVIDESSKPAISGGKVVWSANHKIYLRDMDAHIQRYIVDGDDPAIDGDKIAYTRDDDERPDVYYLDLAENKDQETLVSNEGDNYYVQLSGDKIIWSDFNTRTGHIDMYDMSSKQIVEVTSPNDEKDGEEVGEDTGIHPGISGNKIVYEKYATDSMGSAGIYVYDITSLSVVQISGISALQESDPVISGNRVVWVDQEIIYTAMV